jgi:TolA-binding protein
MEKELWEGEKTDLLRKMKELNRKIEELQDDIRLVEEQNGDLKSEKLRITTDLEEVRNAHRAILKVQSGDDE